MKSPDKITEEELRDYFLHVKNVKKWSRSTSTIALRGIKFFYDHTVKCDWPTLRNYQSNTQQGLGTGLKLSPACPLYCSWRRTFPRRQMASFG
ncbi:MAG: phage integrase N-terminal SAM-like domain-containing protein [Deltaproteobacteria bacterium]|nr:phage integrase N-terminal SAM-like domain-containing protein [Deltaproteobacteria bacterium]